MRVIIEERTINQVPVLDIFNPDAADAVPMIIMVHGFGGRKENNLLEAYRFVKEGFYVVAFDAFRHGELMDDAYRRLTKIERGKDFWNIVIKSTGFIDVIIENFNQHTRGNCGRIGLYGLSMGGIIVYNYLTGNPKPGIKAAVPVIATPAWVGLDRAYYQNNEAARQYYNAEESKMIEKIEPYGRLHHIIDLPLLMLNGVKDLEIPIADVRESYVILQKGYSNKALVQLVEYEDVEHKVTNEMIDQASDWFKKYL